jgi:hypothetical protein
MTLHGHIENGGIKFDPPIALPDGAAVEVQLQVLSSKTEEQSTGTSEPPTLLERMKDFVGTFDGLPADASTNLDHYLYGSPKRQ